MKRVAIHYHRPPSGLEIYEQWLLHDAPDVKVTLLPEYRGRTVRVSGRAILDVGAPVLWFTFPERWHDIGRFHRADGTVTGLYANILTPVLFENDHWSTTDLFLDLWIPEEGPPHVLDEDELLTALAEDWIDAKTAARAREELDRLRADHARGAWPPDIVRTFRFDPGTAREIS